MQDHLTLEYSFDEERRVSAIYIPFSGAIVNETKEVAPGLLVDLDIGGNLVGVEMLHPGRLTIKVIKEVRVLKPDLGLKEAKDLVDNVPKELLTDVNKEDAEKFKKQLEEAGAEVELK